MNRYIYCVVLSFFSSNVFCADYSKTIVPFRPSAASPIGLTDGRFIETKVKSGQGMFHALKDLGVENDVALELINVLRDEVEFSKLKVGDTLQGTFNFYNELMEFSFSQNIAEKHSLVKNFADGSWNYSFREEESFWVTKVVEGSIDKGSSLLSSLLKKGFSSKVANEVISALMCKVNFRMDSRLGDSYRALINERKFKDEVIETKVLYTSYRGRRAGVHETFLFEDAEKGSAYNAHYTEDGQALIRSGLRYPLSRIHVRSNFGMRRHPVTGRRSMHRGVDLRARSGAPVYAVARGRVIMSSYDKYAGNKIGIKHQDGSSSYYFHLKNRSVNKGSYVRAHQLIGRAGSTGRVTGAHLHFGFKRANGKWMNPLSKRMIATPKLSGTRLEQLTHQIERTKLMMLDLELNKQGTYLLAHIPNLRRHEEFKVEDLFNLYDLQVY